MFLHAESEDSALSLFAGRTCHFVGFVIGRLLCPFARVTALSKTLTTLLTTAVVCLYL